MRRHRGFTLVEVLLVLVIIAIMASAIGLAARPGADRELSIATQQIKKALQGLSLEALAQSEVLALNLSENTLALSAWQRERWEDYPAPFALPALPAHVQLSLSESGEGRRILLFPSGEYSAFVLTLRSSVVDAAYTLRSNGLQLAVEGLE